VYKAKEGKMTSLKDMLQGYSTQPVITATVKPPGGTVGMQHYSHVQHFNQIPITHAQHRVKTQPVDVPARLNTLIQTSKKSKEPVVAPNDSEG